MQRKNEYFLPVEIPASNNYGMQENTLSKSELGKASI